MLSGQAIFVIIQLHYWVLFCYVIVIRFESGVLIGWNENSSTVSIFEKGCVKLGGVEINLHIIQNSMSIYVYWTRCVALFYYFVSKLEHLCLLFVDWHISFKTSIYLVRKFLSSHFSFHCLGCLFQELRAKEIVNYVSTRTISHASLTLCSMHCVNSHSSLKSQPLYRFVSIRVVNVASGSIYWASCTLSYHS